MTLTLEQMDALCEAAEHADDKTMFHVRAVVNAILPLHRAMIIEEVVNKCARIAEEAWLVPPDGGSASEEVTDVCQEAAARIRSLATQEKKP